MVKEGDVIEGVITSIGKSFILVNVGLKSEGEIPVQQFPNAASLEVGSKVSVYGSKTFDTIMRWSCSLRSCLQSLKNPYFCSLLLPFALAFPKPLPNFSVTQYRALALLTVSTCF